MFLAVYCDLGTFQPVVDGAFVCFGKQDRNYAILILWEARATNLQGECNAAIDLLLYF